MEKVKRIQKNNEVDEDFKLTEEDIQALLEAEEDIREGRVYTLEELIENLKRECGFKGKYLDKLLKS